MPNDPDKFNNFNGMNNSDNQDDFIDSSFAVQFKPGDKTESIADKLKESKENLEKKNSSFNNGFKDEFDDFEFDSSISAFKPFKAPEEPAAPVKEEPKPEVPKAEAPKSTVSTEPAFPKDGGTFDKPLSTAKAPEPAKNAIPKFDDLDEALCDNRSNQFGERGSSSPAMASTSLLQSTTRKQVLSLTQKSLTSLHPMVWISPELKLPRHLQHSPQDSDLILLQTRPNYSIHLLRMLRLHRKQRKLQTRHLRQKQLSPLSPLSRHRLSLRQSLLNTLNRQSLQSL